MSDQEDFDALSRRLAATDFSADSRVRASLRARLLGGKRRERSFSPARVAALTLAFAAVLVVAMLPLRRKLDGSGVVSIVTRITLPPPAPRAAARLVPPASTASRTVFPRGENGLPVLPGRMEDRGAAVAQTPLSSKAIDRLIDIHRGRTVRRKDGSAVVWEIDGTAYSLETRRITIDDIFEKRSL